MRDCIQNDKGKIRFLEWENGQLVQVGLSGVVSIEAYEEPGEMAMVLWFKVVREDGGYSRYNGKYVSSVYYFKDGENNQQLPQSP